MNYEKSDFPSLDFVDSFPEEKLIHSSNLEEQQLMKSKLMPENYNNIEKTKNLEKQIINYKESYAHLEFDKFAKIEESKQLNLNIIPINKEKQEFNIKIFVTSSQNKNS